MKSRVSIRHALENPELLGTVLAGDTWLPWRSILIAAMGEELTAAERTLFQHVTGRPSEPLERVEELWAVVGRRGGKTRAASALAAYLACCVDYADKLAVGERGLILLIAQNTKQATVAFNYLAGLFRTVPALAELVLQHQCVTA